MLWPSAAEAFEVKDSTKSAPLISPVQRAYSHCAAAAKSADQLRSRGFEVVRTRP
jgi:hypothetical protein